MGFGEHEIISEQWIRALLIVCEVFAAKADDYAASLCWRIVVEKKRKEKNKK